MKVIPYFAVKPSSMAVELGKNVRLDCLAVGVPLSLLHWKIDGKNVSSGVGMANGSLLLLSSRSTGKNGRSHICGFKMGGRRYEASAKIVVYGKETEYSNNVVGYEHLKNNLVDGCLVRITFISRYIHTLSLHIHNPKSVRF